MADELRINQVDLLRLQPGDILFVDCGTDDPDEVEQIGEAINSALTHAGVADNVSALLHEGNIKLILVRSD